MNEKKINKSPSVLVTGSTGFLGKRLVRALSDNGYHVRITVRDPSKADYFKKLNVEICSCDICDEDAVRSAVKGVDLIVHAAAAQEGDWSNFEQTTIMGTERIFRIAKENNVKRLIYISSMSVYQMHGIRPHSVLTENSALESKPIERGYYTASKLEAEKIARDFLDFNQSGLPTVILRPATIYGPGGSIFNPMIGISILKKIFIILGNIRMKLPFIYIDNLVDAILLSLEHEKAIGEIFNAIDDNKITKGAYVKSYIKKAFNNSVVFYLPFCVVSKLVFLQESFLNLLKKKPILTRYRLNSASNNLDFSNYKIKTTLGWLPVVSTHDGLEKTFSWFRSKQ